MVPAPGRPAPGALSALIIRCLHGLLTAWAAVTVTFFGLRVGAGDPLAGILAQGLASPQQAEALRHSLGLDRPLPAQYLSFLTGLLRGDLGRSLYTGLPVLRVIGGQLPSTLALGASGLLVAVVGGLALGTLAAWRKRSLWGRSAASAAALATALPVSFTGIVAILAFSTLLSGRAASSLYALRHLALPALVLGIASAGAIGRVVEAGLSQSLASPYVAAARARGVPSGLRLLWHALRPALPPAVSLIALEAAYLFSGTVVTETVFSRPGLGRLLIGAILQGDYPVAQGVVALAALFYTLSHILADLLSLGLDPRLRGKG